MDNISKRFLQRILLELSNLSSSVRRVAEHLQNPSDRSDIHKSSPDDKKGNANIPIEAVTGRPDPNPIPSVAHHDTTYEKATNGLRKRKPWIELAGFIVLVIYTTYAGCQTAAVREANRISQEALVSVQRAFISFDQTLEATRRVGATDRNATIEWEFRNKLQNDGSTPARHVIQSLSAAWTPNVMPANFSFFEQRTEPPAALVVGAKQTIIGGLVTLPIDILSRIKNRQGHLYFWGWATYGDIFGTATHVTMMCTEMLAIDGEPTKSVESVRFSFGACQRHNCADEECKGEPYGSPPQVWK